MELDFRGKSVLVTGGTSGIGRTLVRTFGACGADVAIHYNTNHELADKLVSELHEMGVGAMAVQADVTDRDSVFEMQKKVSEELGDPAVYVTNAVTTTFWKTVLETPNEEYRKQYRGSILQNVFMAQAFAPAMIKKHYGRIIGINTEAILMNDPTFSSYNAGKKGMDGLMRVLAKELGPYNITVNQIAPGNTITEKSYESGTVDIPAYTRRVPMGRRPTAQDIANAVVFFASEHASNTTGCYVPVSGGIVIAGV